MKTKSQINKEYAKINNIPIIDIKLSKLEQNVNKQESNISPNFIHSLDASMYNQLPEYIRQANEEHHPIIRRSEMEVNDLGNTPAQQVEMDILANDHDERVSKMHNKETPFIDRLRDLCGYVENASDTVVSVFQDDATMDWVIKVGKHSYYNKSFNEIFEEAFSDPKNNPF